MEKNYIDRSITKEINKKINTINKTRNSRINASKRLYNYAEHWELLFFFFNALAIIYVLLSAVHIQNETFTTVTGCFTLYVIILQYYISKKNFKERALRFHYHQLELEKNIQALKMLLIKNKWSNEIALKKKYKDIMNEYNLNLINIENHDDSDYNKTIKNIKENDNSTEDNVSKNEKANEIKKGGIWESIILKLNKDFIFLFSNYIILLTLALLPIFLLS